MLDPETFKVAYAEYLQGDEVVSYSKYILEAQQEINTLDEVFNTKEVGNNEVKPIKADRYFGYNVNAVSQLAKTFKESSSKYNILTSNQMNKESMELDISNYDNKEYSKLVYTKDYDPSYDPETSWYFEDMLHVYAYSRESNDYYYILKSAQEVDRYLKVNYGDSNIIKGEANVLIDNTKINATSHTVQYKDENGMVYSEYVNISFTFNGSYYLFTIYDYEMVQQKNYDLNLNLLSSEEVANIGQRMDNRINATVRMEPKQSITEVSESTRYVSSIIQDNTQKWFLNNVYSPLKKPSESTCADYISYFYSLIECMVERYEGTEYGYANNSNDPDSSKSQYIRLFILNTSSKEFNLQKECVALGEEICTLVNSEDKQGISFKNSKEMEDYANDIFWLSQVDGKVVLFSAEIDPSSQKLNNAFDLVSKLSKDYDENKVDEVLKNNIFMPMF